MAQGLRQKILAATSEAEVLKLLAEGKTYEFASRKTSNSWKSAGRRALKQKAPEPVAKTEGEEFVSAKKARKSRK